MKLKQFYRYVFVFLLSVFVFTGCGSDNGGGAFSDGGGSNGNTQKTTITGYAEDDPMANAKIKVTDSANNLIAEATADANGKYSLEANFEEGKTYTLESKGKIGDRDITMHSIFEFDKDTVVNVNPITEITYRLSKETSLPLKEINLKVLSYFGITDYSEAEKIRFLNTSKAYDGMKTFSKSDVPMDSVDAFKSDIKDDLKNLRLMILNDLKIVASSKSVEIGKVITFSLNKEFTDDYNITWAGVDKNSDSPQLISTYVGNRDVAVKVTYNGKTILSDSTSVNFYKVASKENISISDNSVDKNSTINDITITIPKNSLPSGVSNISITEIDTGKTDILKTLKLEPSGTIFNSPLTIRVPYDLATVTDPSKLFIERLEDDGSVEILKPTVDYRQQELVFQTDHFSTFSIKTDSDGRKYVDDSYFDDIEDKLFVTDGKYSISLPSLNDTNMYELIKDAVYGNYLTQDMKDVVEEFYDEGYDYELDGFDSNYEKAFRYVLAETVRTENLTESMNKYELLVDSLKKYRVAKLIDAYIENDMLVKPYDNWGIGVTTKSDFFNEILKVERESYGLAEDKGFHINSNPTLDAIMSTKDTIKFLSSTAKSILTVGYYATGQKIGWDVVKGIIIDDVKHEFTKHLTNESLTHLQCFDYDEIEGTYSLGNTVVVTFDEYSNSFEAGDTSDLDKLNDIFAASSSSNALKAMIGSYYGDSSGQVEKFVTCMSQKIQKIDEFFSDDSDFGKGLETISIRLLTASMQKTIIKLEEMIDNGTINEYGSILKIINFDKEQLKEYSKYLKTLAIANTAPIINDIVVEAELIDGESIEDIEDDNFFINDAVKQEALVKFKKYYSGRSLRSVKDESSDKIKVFGLEAFENLKLRIDKKYMDKFSLDVVKLDINYINLDKKVSTDDITANYYETSGVFKELNLKTIDVKLEDYTLNESNNKYEISLKKLFKDIDVSEIAYLDVKLSILFKYNSKPYYVEKTFNFVADSNPDEIVVDDVEKGSFTVYAQDESANPLSNVEVYIGENKCETNATGECSVQGLIPAQYKISLIKDGYFPKHKDSFIDVASTKKIEFTLKTYDTSATIALDVVGVRSEVNPMEYKFYINALGSNLDLNISFGDGTELSGSLRYLLRDDNYITHEYTSKGKKTVNVKITNEETSLEKTLNTYPIDSDKVIDVVFLVDLSGSYGSSLSNFKSKAVEIAEGFSTLGSDTRVGLASFDEFPSYAGSDDFAYAQNKELTYDFDSFNYAVNEMDLKWGGDDPESQLEGLYQIAKTFNWNDKSEKFIFIATDASFHNSDIEDGYPGPGYTKTLEALKAKNIKVIGLNRGGYDIDDVTKVTNDTSGTIFYLDSSSSDIVDKIMNFSSSSSISRSLIHKKVIEKEIGSTIQGNAN